MTSPNFSNEPEVNALLLLTKILSTQTNFLGPRTGVSGQTGRDAGQHITDLYDHLLDYFRKNQKKHL